MCLFSNPLLSRPICPRTYYKVVQRNRRPLFYVDNDIVYRPGSVISAFPVLGDRELDWFRNHKWLPYGGIYQFLYNRTLGDNAGVGLRIYDGFALSGGVIHVYTDLQAAQAVVHKRLPDWPVLSQNMVIEVKCRPEHFVAMGEDHEAAYTQVEVLD